MQSFRVICVVSITIILWASAFIGIRIGLNDYSPGSLALLRFLVASLFIGIIYYSHQLKTTIPWKARAQLILTGMAGIGIYNICLNYGELTVSAGIASFIIGLMPIMTIILSFLFLRERTSIGVWFGVLVSIAGLLLLSYADNNNVDMHWGVLAILISALLGSILTIIQKRFSEAYHPVAIISWIIWGGTLLLLVFTPQLLRDSQHAQFQTTFSAIYMGIFPAAIAYLTWGYALKYLPAVKAAATLYALPLVSTVMAYWLLDEQCTLLTYVGSLITLVGAVIANRSRVKTQKLAPLTH